MSTYDPSTVNGIAWEFFLYITNRTKYVLTLNSAKLNWGVWYRNSQDNQDESRPISVTSQESIQALGIRAAHGTATGYECRCVWSVEKDGKGYGTIDLKINVPYTGKNTSTLTSTKNIRVEGWEDLPQKGHNFTRSIVISDLAELSVPNELPQQMPDPQDKAYYDLLMSNNEMVQDWSKLKKLEEKEFFTPIEHLPEKYTFPPREIFVGRSAQNVIRPEMWEQIDDPIYQYFWQKQEYVEQYFSVAIYSVNTDPRQTVSVSKGVEVVQEGSVEVTSSITNTLTTTLSLRALLKAEYSGLAAELESNYSVEDVRAESNSRVERESKTITIGASEKNRLFVPWVFSTALAIYRQKKDGTITLIGISEWAQEIINQVYEY